MTAASRTSWKTLPPPERRAAIEVNAVFSDAEGDRMRRGFIPANMDDRWFVYLEDGWLNFHRSWTGSHIYALRVDGAPHGVRIIDGWVSRNDDEYRSPSIDHDRDFVVRLVKSLFGDEAHAL